MGSIDPQNRMAHQYRPQEQTAVNLCDREAAKRSTIHSASSLISLWLKRRIKGLSKREARRLRKVKATFRKSKTLAG
jgi:hypothetical protein